MWNIMWNSCNGTMVNKTAKAETTLRCITHLKRSLPSWSSYKYTHSSNHLIISLVLLSLSITELGRIRVVGSDQRSHTVKLFQCLLNVFTDQTALKLKTHERGRDRKRGMNRYDILPVLFLRLCPTDIIGSVVDRVLRHLVYAARTLAHSRERLNK